MDVRKYDKKEGRNEGRSGNQKILAGTTKPPPKKNINKEKERQTEIEVKRIDGMKRIKKKNKRKHGIRRKE